MVQCYSDSWDPVILPLNKNFKSPLQVIRYSRNREYSQDHDKAITPTKLKTLVKTMDK